jgi:deferrochelatase/peroxidase EfeB
MFFYAAAHAAGSGTALPLMEYIEHTGSAVFACPPGVAEGSLWGETLFA